MLHLLQTQIKLKSAPNPDCININITYFESGEKEQKNQGMKQVTLKIYKILLLVMPLSDAYPSFLLKTLSS
jgi:hypothetical protein